MKERSWCLACLSGVLGMACLCKPRRKAYREGIDKLDKRMGKRVVMNMRVAD